MADFGDEEYDNMVCLEAGHTAEPYVLKSSEQVTMGQTLRI
jgi:D-hexose-6-phosphate mutarotase